MSLCCSDLIRVHPSGWTGPNRQRELPVKQVSATTTRQNAVSTSLGLFPFALRLQPIDGRPLPKSFDEDDANKAGFCLSEGAPAHRSPFDIGKIFHDRAAKIRVARAPEFKHAKSSIAVGAACRPSRPQISLGPGN